MASIRFGGGIADARGSHGGSVFSRNHSGATLSIRTAGVNPNTISQSKYRQILPHLNQRWKYTLTIPQRVAWRVFAASQPIVNRLGVTTTLTGHQMFCKLNGVITMSGLAPIDNPPGSTAVSVPVSGSVIAVHGSPGTLTFTNATTNIGGSEDVVLFMTPPISPGITYVNSKLRLIAFFTHDFGPGSVLSNYTDGFGTFPLTAGAQIIWRFYVRNYTTGITSPSLQGSTIIT